MINKIILIIVFCVFNYSWAQESARPWIGVMTAVDERGVLVKEVIEDTPAAKAKLEAGIIINKVNDKSIANLEELIKELTNIGVGKKATLHFIKKGNKKGSKDLTLVARPGILELAKKKLLNKKAPTFKFARVNGSKKSKIDLSKIKQKTLITFWATWCVACHQARPEIEKFAKENPQIEVLAISNEKLKKIKKYLKKNVPKSKIKFLHEPSDSDISGTYFVSAIPYFVVLDKDKIVRKLSIGIGSELDKTLKFIKEL